MLAIEAQERQAPYSWNFQLLHPRDIAPPHRPDLIRPDLISLIKGYKFNGSGDHLLSKAKLEYGLANTNTPNDCFHILLAADKNDPDRAIGSLILIEWRERANMWASHWFWNKLNKDNPEYADKLRHIGRPIFEVGGIVTRPEYEGKGVPRGLYTEAVRTFRPAAFIGQTKNPKAVVARDNSLAGFGYVTTCADEVITPGHAEMAGLHHPLQAAYLEGKEVKEDLQPGSVCRYEDAFLKPDIPTELEDYPPAIQRAFRHVIWAQYGYNQDAKMYGGKVKTAVAQLLSIDRDAFPKALKHPVPRQAILYDYLADQLAA